MKARTLLLGAAAVGLAMLGGRFIVPGRYRKELEDAGAAEGVSPDLLHALQLTENPGQDPAAIGALNANGTRDYGLMQINVRNFDRLGLGGTKLSNGQLLPDTEAWKDPALSARAAAKLLRANQAAAPRLTVSDQFSVYNAGFSDDTTAGLRPKLDAAGGYFNGEYVRRAFLWFLLVSFSALFPIKRIGWEA